jgi:hypothetical protein
LKEDGEEKEGREISCKDNELASPVARIGRTKAQWQRLFEHAESRIDDEHSDDCGYALPQERERKGASFRRSFVQPPALPVRHFRRTKNFLDNDEMI